RRSARRCASAACGCSTTSPSAGRPTAGSTSCIPRMPAGCSWNWSSRLPQGTDQRTRGTGYRPVTSAGATQPLRAHEAPGDRVNEIRDAILADELDALGGLAVPESYRGVLVRRDEQDMFEGLPTKDKDPNKSLHVEEVPTPVPGPGEALVAVM